MKLNIRPTTRFLYAAFILLVSTLLFNLSEIFVMIFYLFLLFLFLLSVADIYNLYKIRLPEINRLVPHALPVGNWHKVELQIEHSITSRVRLEIFDHIPDQCQFKSLPLKVIPGPSTEYSLVNYQIRPVQRGALSFGRIECLITTGLGLWRRRFYAGSEEKLLVYPDYKPVLEYLLLATENRVSSMGIIKQRRRGQGMDFHQLREFRDGDSIKQIDWKASSRIRKIIAREYQEERDQEIIFLMDCGHRMLSKDDDLSDFDYILNSVLLMSYVALRQGDAVGIATFGQQDPRWIKPIKGTGRINSLLKGIFDLQPGIQAPDYINGASFLLSKHRKRALVIILSNLRDNDTDDIQQAVQLLKKQHNVVVVSLRESAIQKVFDQPVQNLEQAATLAAAEAYLSNRNRLLKLLGHYRVHTLDVLPNQLPLALTNAYLDLKASGQV